MPPHTLRIRALDLLKDGQRFLRQLHGLRSLPEAVLRQAHIEEGGAFASSVAYLLGYLQGLLVVLDGFARFTKRGVGPAQVAQSVPFSSTRIWPSG